MCIHLRDTIKINLFESIHKRSYFPDVDHLRPVIYSHVHNMSLISELLAKVVILVETGIQFFLKACFSLDSRLRGNDA